MELWQTFFFPLPEEVTYTSTAPALRRAAEMCPVQLSGWTNWNVICHLESNFPVRMKWSTYLLLPRDVIPHIPATRNQLIHLGLTAPFLVLLQVGTTWRFASCQLRTRSSSQPWVKPDQAAEHLFWWQHNHTAARSLRALPPCWVLLALQLAQCP